MTGKEISLDAIDGIGDRLLKANAILGVVGDISGNDRDGDIRNACQAARDLLDEARILLDDRTKTT